MRFNESPLPMQSVNSKNEPFFVITHGTEIQ